MIFEIAVLAGMTATSLQVPEAQNDSVRAQAEWSRPQSGPIIEIRRGPEDERRVEVSCVVNERRILADCRILSESPEGQGYGVAALQTMAQRPRVPESVPIGATVRNTVRFRLEDDPVP